MADLLLLSSNLSPDDRNTIKTWTLHGLRLCHIRVMLQLPFYPSTRFHGNATPIFILVVIQHYFHGTMPHGTSLVILHTFLLLCHTFPWLHGICLQRNAAFSLNMSLISSLSLSPSPGQDFGGSSATSVDGQDVHFLGNSRFDEAILQRDDCH